MADFDRLDAAAITRGLAASGETLDVQVLARCASTNTELLARAPQPGGRPALLVANEQTAGRGRRGRRWHAGPGSALMFSLRWEFAGDPVRLHGLSLAVGVSIARTLRALGARGVCLKWPNDLLAPGAESSDAVGAKLGGILIETRSGAGSVCAVIGVGLNCRRTPGLEEKLGRKVAALEDALTPLPARDELAVHVVAGLVQAMRLFEREGFGAFRTDWESLHAYQGAPMRVRTGDGRVVTGIADGIAADGGLLLRNRRGVKSIHSGTVLLRGASPRSPAAHRKAA